MRLSCRNEHYGYCLFTMDIFKTKKSKHEVHAGAPFYRRDVTDRNAGQNSTTSVFEPSELIWAVCECIHCWGNEVVFVCCKTLWYTRDSFEPPYSTNGCLFNKLCCIATHRCLCVLLYWRLCIVYFRCGIIYICLQLEKFHLLKLIK